jgi:hypothetical protein
MFYRVNIAFFGTGYTASPRARESPPTRTSPVHLRSLPGATDFVQSSGDDLSSRVTDSNCSIQSATRWRPQKMKLRLNNIWLVVFRHPSEKYEFVSWEYY